MSTDFIRHETYLLGYDAVAMRFMARRSAENSAAFVLPRLGRGSRLLDCGCGPGTISLGLAQRIAPGELIGIDSAASQVEAARALCAGNGLRNALFEQASVYALPFEDGRFDGVFSNALFEHLARPEDALAEIRRVLRPGGFVALRAPDWGGFLIEPLDALGRQAIEYYEHLQNTSGGDTRSARRLGRVLRETGFREVFMQASMECYPDLNVIGELILASIERNPPKQPDLGMRMALTLRDWMGNPDSLFFQCWCEAIAVKPVTG